MEITVSKKRPTTGEEFEKVIFVDGLEVNHSCSDGYHSFEDLYKYRMAFNALLFNEWAEHGKYEVHKSKKHGDGEECFGGGWFIVVAQLPTGQISNHYEMKWWHLFKVTEKELADTYDGHSPELALDRMFDLLNPQSISKETTE